MPDVVLLVPSRGRPQNAERLIDACVKTCRANTVLHFGFDYDDPALTANRRAASGCLHDTGSRQGLVAWTNQLAAQHLDVPALGSIGDDMVPVTDGWDEILLGELDRMGGGWAAPDTGRRAEHGRQPGTPEACLISSYIVRALGWMMQPSLDHWYPDTVWRGMGRALGRYAYRPDVMVRHYHPNVPGGDPHDSTYADAARCFGADRAAYARWRLLQMHRDVGTVRGILRAPRQAI